MALVTEDEIVDIAIRLEESGEAFYTAAADKMANDKIRLLFQELSMQEQEHRRAFQQMGRNAVKLAYTPEQWEQFQAYVGALLQQTFFRNPESALERATTVTDPASALEAALGFEKESILFYQELQAVVQETNRQIVARVIREEKHHLERLADVLADLSPA